jgi:guanylate kinase
LEEFDIFLSHNTDDSAFVEEIASILESAGFRPFLDRWHIIPGEPWQEALERAIQQSKTCGVCISPSGTGPWQNEEMRIFLEKRVRDNGIRVIPILLPETNDQTLKKMSPFLSRLHCVDFRAGIPSVDALQQLIAGISGVLPKDVILPFQVTNQNNQHNICVVFSGPSSVGKDVIMSRIMNIARTKGCFPELLCKYTTRSVGQYEQEGHPFIFLDEATFKKQVSSGNIGCVRHSYGNYYGIDQTFSFGLKLGDLLFVTQRLYSEIDVFRHLAIKCGFKTFAVLINADVDTLKNRVLHRSFSSDQKNKRAAQIIEDSKYLSSESNDLSTKFDLIVDNGDNSRLNDTIQHIWTSLAPHLRINEQ